jgi:uracil-DNA glycosylase
MTCRECVTRQFSDGLGRLPSDVIVALGVTAAQSLAERALRIQSNRGAVLDLANGLRVLVAIHPSALLRLRDDEDKRSGYASL